MIDGGFSLVRFFEEGGWPMYFVLAMGASAHLLALAALGSMVAKRRAIPLVFGAGTLLLAVSTLCVGAGGFVFGMRQVEEAVAFADSADRDLMRARGREEADNNLYFGGCAFLLPFFAGVSAIGRGATMKDRG